MRIIKISEQAIKEAVELLEDGGTVVYPTDTAYALGADPEDRGAVFKIYKIKNRLKSLTLPCIAASLPMVKKFFVLGALEQKVAQKHWPAPLSMILQIRRGAPASNKFYSSVLKNIGIRALAVRVPENKVARKLSKNLGRPIISTSANVSGAGEFYSAKAIYEHFKNRKYQPDLILDGGVLPKRKPSTIVKVIGEKMKVLRLGPIKI